MESGVAHQHVGETNELVKIVTDISCRYSISRTVESG
jgi:hypothetical protein